MGLAGGGGGGGAVTQFLGGVSALLSGDSPCLGLGELLGEECEEARGGLGLLAWLDYVLSQGCLNLRSTLPFSLWGAEESVPYSLGVWRVSLWSSEARIGFCLSVQLPSFRVFLTPPPPSSSCLSAAWGVGLCLCLGASAAGRKSVALGEVSWHVTEPRERGLEAPLIFGLGFLFYLGKLSSHSICCNPTDASGQLSE